MTHGESRENLYAIFFLHFSYAMADPHDRSDRFELIAACDEETLAGFANDILEDDPPLLIRQDPKPKLLMQQVQEPVERRPFNLGEVVVTPAEIELGDTRGFAMIPGKKERAALSGAIVDAAVATDHERTPAIVAELRAAEARQRNQTRQSWAESCHTTVNFETMENQQ